jgi:hypothetical protein
MNATQRLQTGQSAFGFGLWALGFGLSAQGDGIVPIQRVGLCPDIHPACNNHRRWPHAPSLNKEETFMDQL